MGLDMQLSAVYYLNMNPNKVTIVSDTKEGKRKRIFTNVSKLICPIGYWRKANHIHRWFVQEIQDNKDDCGEHEVSMGQLAILEILCKEVLKMKDTPEFKNIATQLLPRFNGFYFGSQEYDSYYIDDLKNTLKIIKNAEEAVHNGADLVYESTW